MINKIMILLVFLLQTACQEPLQSDLLEIAHVGRDKSLFYLDGDTVVRSGCDPNVIVINHANCTRETQKLYLWGVNDSLRLEFGDELEAYNFKIIQNQIKIINIDTQLDQLMSTIPDRHLDLLPEILRLQEQLADIETLISGVSDQIARIRQYLSQFEDEDQRALLQQHETKIANLRNDRGRLQGDLFSLRSRHYDLNSSILNQATYQRLLNQRKSTVLAFDTAVSGLANQMLQLVALDESIKFLKDGAIWEFTNQDNDGTAQVVHALSKIFYNYFNAISDHVDPKWDAENRRFVMVVPGVGDMLSTITMRFGRNSKCTGYHIYGKNFDLRLFGTADLHFTDYPAEAAPLFEKSIDGKWFLEPICTGPLDHEQDKLYIYRKRN